MGGDVACVWSGKTLATLVYLSNDGTDRECKIGRTGGDLVNSQSICTPLDLILHPGFGAKINAYPPAPLPFRLACNRANHLSSPIGFDLV